jgi:hypothetical protein
MPATHVQALHDDGRWYLALLLGQHRTDGRWRAVVRYSVAPGMTYERGVWADDLRPVAGADDDHEQGDGEAADDQAERQDGSGQDVAWVVPHGRRP